MEILLPWNVFITSENIRPFLQSYLCLYTVKKQEKNHRRATFQQVFSCSQSCVLSRHRTQTSLRRSAFTCKLKITIGTSAIPISRVTLRLKSDPSCEPFGKKWTPSCTLIFSLLCQALVDIEKDCTSPDTMACIHLACLCSLTAWGFSALRWLNATLRKCTHSSAIGSLTSMVLFRTRPVQPGLMRR